VAKGHFGKKELAALLRSFARPVSPLFFLVTGVPPVWAVFCFVVLRFPARLLLTPLRPFAFCLWRDLGIPPISLFSSPFCVCFSFSLNSCVAGGSSSAGACPAYFPLGGSAKVCYFGRVLLRFDPPCPPLRTLSRDPVMKGRLNIHIFAPFRAGSGRALSFCSPRFRGRSSWTPPPAAWVRKSFVFLSSPGVSWVCRGLPAGGVAGFFLYHSFPPQWFFVRVMWFFSPSLFLIRSSFERNPIVLRAVVHFFVSMHFFPFPSAHGRT